MISVHKGLAGGNPYASPIDIGPAAAANPDIRFLVYHSGYDNGTTEGPYDPDGNGVDRLVRSVTEAGVGAGANVYAELGSTWRILMGDPDAAAHVLGKLLTAFGPERILWGTDSIWYGSPQDQIAAFRAFEISPAFQEQFGYPALTAEVKQRIMAANAAELFGITVPEPACEPAARKPAVRPIESHVRARGPARRGRHVPARASLDRRFPVLVLERRTVAAWTRCMVIPPRRLRQVGSSLLTAVAPDATATTCERSTRLPARCR